MRSHTTGTSNSMTRLAPMFSTATDSTSTSSTPPTSMAKCDRYNNTIMIITVSRFFFLLFLWQG